MVIHDLDIVRAVVAPLEANAPSIIDPDAELPLPVAAEGFEPIAGQEHQGLDALGSIQNAKALFGLTGKGLEPQHPFALEELPRALVLEAPDHLDFYPEIRGT